jgi:hypothetical protein
MLYAGRRQSSMILVTLFTGWVLCPFAAALFSISQSRRWGEGTRRALYAMIAILGAVSLAVYGATAFGYVKSKIGFVFLVVPLISTALIGSAWASAAVAEKRHKSRE